VPPLLPGIGRRPLDLRRVNSSQPVAEGVVRAANAISCVTDWPAHYTMNSSDTKWA
jgi:hypothetical protein